MAVHDASKSGPKAVTAHGGRITIVALAAASTAALVFMLSRGPAQQSAASATSGDLAQLRRELDELRAKQSNPAELAGLKAEVAALRAHQSLAQPAAAPVQADSAVPDRNADHVPADPIARNAQIRAKNVEVANRVGDELDTLLRGDVIDREWSAQTIESMSKVFSSIDDSRVTQADCRARLCRVTIEHNSTEAQESLSQKILSHPPFNEDVLFRYDFDSKPPRTTLYVTRHGVTVNNLLHPAL